MVPIESPKHDGVTVRLIPIGLDAFLYWVLPGRLFILRVLAKLRRDGRYVDWIELPNGTWDKYGRPAP